MKPRRAPAGARILLASLAGIFCLASLLSAVLSPAAGNDSPSPDFPKRKRRLGERIYRDGILPSGEPTHGRAAQGDIPRGRDHVLLRELSSAQRPRVVRRGRF